MKQKKPDTKDYILNYLIYLKDKNRQNKCRVIKIREWLPLGWGILNLKGHERTFYANGNSLYLISAGDCMGVYSCQNF